MPLFLALLFAAAPVPSDPPKPGDVAKLVARLGSEDFAEREAAAKRIEELGAAAIDELRAALKSENPEVVRRAHDLLRKAERSADNEKTTAPTLVELDATDRPLDAVLADLSKQSGYEVVLAGPKLAELAARKVTVSTGGKVPFWVAVQKTSDAAGLQIAAVGGFVAPGSPPPRFGGPAGVRVARDVNQAVVLEPRGDAKRRPAAVRGAVLVEAVPFPKGVTPAHPSVLLQVWPEPRLRWEGTTGTKVSKATGDAGARLVPEFVPPDAADVRRKSDGVVMVRNPDGTASFVRDTGGSGFELPGGFRPNARQAVVRFKPADGGPVAANELSVSVLGVARTGTEPLCRVRGLQPNKEHTAGGPSGAEVSFTFTPDGSGGWTARAHVVFEPGQVQLAGVSDDLPGTRGGGAGVGNHTVSGVRVTDGAGKPFLLGLSTGLTRRDPAGKKTAVIMQLGLTAGRDGPDGPPDTLTVWGTYRKPVEVPVVLKNVELTGK